jgi:tetratricopeptide (TPR) repeat protein
LIIALGILIYRFRKQRLFILGILFFVLNLLPVIRIVPFGGAITADRYAYMPMIGILFLIPLMIPHKQDLKQLKIAIGILAMFALYLAGANIYRLPVWESDKSFYTDILERYPSSQIIRLKRAYAAQAVNKDFQSSIADYDTLIMNDPKYIDAYVQRALVHKAMGDSLSALTDANTALKLKPNMPDVYHFRSSLNFMMNNYEQAVRDCDSAQKYHTGMMAESYYTEAYVFERMGNPAAAKDNYLKAIESNPDYLDAYINLGAIDLAMKDFESAKKNYTEVMRLAPQNPLPYLQRGKAFLALGDTANAVRDFQMFKTSGYNNADSILNVLKK